jgi:hypothetical protein
MLCEVNGSTPRPLFAQSQVKAFMTKIDFTWVVTFCTMEKLHYLRTLLIVGSTLDIFSFLDEIPPELYILYSYDLKYSVTFILIETVSDSIPLR